MIGVARIGLRGRQRVATIELRVALRAATIETRGLLCVAMPARLQQTASSSSSAPPACHSHYQHDRTTH